MNEDGQFIYVADECLEITAGWSSKEHTPAEAVARSGDQIVNKVEKTKIASISVEALYKTKEPLNQNHNDTVGGATESTGPRKRTPNAERL